MVNLRDLIDDPMCYDTVRSPGGVDCAHCLAAEVIGISQEKLPLYLGFFEFAHNAQARGKSLLGSLIGLLLSPPRDPE